MKMDSLCEMQTPQKRVLALYDIAGIQRYIFRTSKLKDIIGASKLVSDALSIIMEKIFKSKEEYKNARFFSGGGNSILQFESVEKWREFNASFSRKLLLEAPGLSFATVCEDSQNMALEHRVNALYAQMAQKKAQGGNSLDIGILPPMAQSTQDHMPVSFIVTDGIDAGDFSYTAWAKHKEGKLTMRHSSGPVEFDAIANPPSVLKKAERLMAVVHIDGNFMGSLFTNACRNSPDKASELSGAIDEAFVSAIKTIWPDSSEEMVIPKEEFFIPTDYRRMIYSAGDDVTYVCHGAYALMSVVGFMKALHKARKENSLLSTLSASAGIAYVKPHFPFSKAYAIAESRCKSAKVQARMQYPGTENIGSWMDFEIVRGSKNAETPNMSYMRPYCIVSPSEETPNNHIEHLLSRLNTIKNGNGARSKWKALRNEYLLGDIESVKLLMRSCNMQPPNGNDEDRVTLDALDLMDVEVPKDTEERQ